MKLVLNSLKSFQLVLLFVTFAQAEFAWASIPVDSVKRHAADLQALQEDFHRIELEANWPKGSLQLLRDVSPVEGVNQAQIHCTKDEQGSSHFLVVVRASDEEWGATAYFALQKLGFFFPHPRIQRSPMQSEALLRCEATVTWLPRLKFRGFHLHTQHPNEWVPGFLGDEPRIGEDTLRWLARNGQNILQVKVLKTNRDQVSGRLAPLLDYGRKLGISAGIDVSFASLQQKAFRLLDEPYLLDLTSALTQGVDDYYLKRSVGRLLSDTDFDWISADMGTSEFTPTHAERTLNWIETVRKALSERGKKLFIKAHVSSHQIYPKYGNYNFLAQYAAPDVGVEPHTVMPFGLLDRSAPVYGRKNFDDLRDFLVAQMSQRPTWYFPETSYWVGIDIDVPVFLTDYLVSRSEDLDFLEAQGIEGQITFSGGQEAGSWLMDWTTALLVNSEYRGRPWIGAELLGESVETWQRIISFQTQYVKQAGLFSILSSANLLDEMPSWGRRSVLDRHTMRDLARSSEGVREEMEKLEAAIAARPSLEGVRDPELKSLLQVTWLRMDHALVVRKALVYRKNSPEAEASLLAASVIRDSAQKLMAQVSQKWDRYPEARNFDYHENPTSYDFGYLWTAKNLHFWKREEDQVRSRNFNPLFENIYNPFDLLF